MLTIDQAYRGIAWTTVILVGGMIPLSPAMVQTIAVSAASELDVSAKPLLMGVCVAAAAAFLTPVATPANLKVMGPGGYRFGDFWKLGLPLMALFGPRGAPRPRVLVVLGWAGRCGTGLSTTSGGSRFPAGR
jgi:di/tricarboxylate transporter